ncbi:MAG: ankyrin repeat domain-containing protein [Fimbriimonadales bacterium]
MRVPILMIECQIALICACNGTNQPEATTSTTPPPLEARTPAVRAAKPKAIKNELVMSPGMTITATTSGGKMVITAIDEFTRTYTWEGATRSAELQPRTERWYGSLGAYFPGPGDHWKNHNGITRGVLEEGQRHVKTVAEALKWIREQSWQRHVHRDDGLFVGWGKVPERNQLNVEVWQIYVKGKKPTRLPGSNNKAIVVRSVKLRATKTSLVEAVRKNDYAAVKRLLSKGANPDVKNAAGSPMLSVAGARGYTAVVRVLLEAGADPNAKNIELEGETPLLLANNIDIARLLLKKGADPNAAHTRGMLRGHTALIGAAMSGDAKLAEVLLKAGANPRTATARGDTALHWASGSASMAIAEMLLERGVEVDARDWAGTTPLIQAVRRASRASLRHRIAIVKYLISKGANVNARLDRTRIEYWRAVFVGDEKAMKRIEQSGKLLKLNEDGPSVLESAWDEEIKAILRNAGAKG